MRTKGTYGKVKAYFTLSLGILDIEDMRLVDGQNGLFTSFPSKKISKEGEPDKYVDLVRLARDSEGKLTESSKKFYDEILETARKEYSRRSGEELVATVEEDDDLPFD